jgi:hypothetical protein
MRSPPWWESDDLLMLDDVTHISGVARELVTAELDAPGRDNRAHR